SKWIIDLAERRGFIAQSTSVPGVAQRTGATIYYLEMFPVSDIEASGKPPVLSLTPVEGDVDIVIASEMMEVGRALMRGFVTANTTLIGSSHREYTIAEKMQLGDGRRQTAQVDELARETAARYICFDMDQVARDNGAVISSVLFGALCASSALPFTREEFEETIRGSGKAVEINLKGFSAGIAAAGGIQQPLAVEAGETQSEPPPPHLDPALAALIEDMRGFLPPVAFTLALSGLEKAIDFQNIDYGREYVERLRAMHRLDAQSGGAQRGWALSEAMARYLALAMAYDDIVRVADIKTRSGRFETFRNDVRAAPGQVVRVREFMHPRWQEICDIMPQGMG
ncbi:MAG: indolepyruvate oxidoreductase subunit beta family protein, partial [Sphingomonadales bacterium]